MHACFENALIFLDLNNFVDILVSSFHFEFEKKLKIVKRLNEGENLEIKILISFYKYIFHTRGEF